MTLEEIKPLIDAQFIYEGELKESTRIIEDLGADSFDIPVLLNALEDHFNLIISTEEMIGLRTLGDLISLLENHLEGEK
ncbi:MAG: acyl carrier protein [Peptococcaceae bacterium]|nr:acyl carrier protein [Peptococcaceae bacterium]